MLEEIRLITSCKGKLHGLGLLEEQDVWLKANSCFLGLTPEEKSESFIEREQQRLKLEATPFSEIKKAGYISEVAKREVMAYCALGNHKYAALLAQVVVPYLQATIEVNDNSYIVQHYKWLIGEYITDINLCIKLAQENKFCLKSYDWLQIADLPIDFKSYLADVVACIVDDEQYLNDVLAAGVNFWPNDCSDAKKLEYLYRSHYVYCINWKTSIAFELSSSLSKLVHETYAGFQKIYKDLHEYPKSSNTFAHPFLPEMVRNKQYIELQVLELILEKVIDFCFSDKFFGAK